MKRNDARLEIRLPAELKDRLDRKAVRDRMSLSDAARTAIRYYLQEGSGRPPDPTTDGWYMDSA